MANWSKRRSRKTGTHTRTTTTINNKGGSTQSTSGRVGTGPRFTDSTKQQNGKIVQRRYMTEYHPILGTKRTTKTVYASSNAKPKKAKKASYKPVKTANRRNRYSASELAAYDRDHPLTPVDWKLGNVLWIIVGLIIIAYIF